MVLPQAVKIPCMDGRQWYTATAPGRLVPTVARRGRVLGFIPDPLPPTLDLPAPTRALLARAHAAVEDLRRRSERITRSDLMVDVLRLREAIHSSASRRNAEVAGRLLCFEKMHDRVRRDPVAAWRNALNYRRTLTLAARLIGRRVPLRAAIQEIHARLFAGQPRRQVFPGRLRRGPIQMGDGARYVPPPYAHVVPCLAALERWLAAVELFFHEGSTRKIQAKHAKRLRLILTMLNVATKARQMDAPGLHLHPLKGKDAGRWAVKVDENYRVIFRFEEGHASEVDYADYH